jgi:hypothetical protein
MKKIIWGKTTEVAGNFFLRHLTKCAYSMLILNLVVLINFSMEIHPTIQNASFENREETQRDFCFMAMTEMIQKKVSPKIINDELYALVKEDNYKNLLLSGKEKITGLWSRQKSCKLLIKDKIIRSFDLFLEEDASHPFYFLIYRIRENELFEKEEEV